jgi:hypothetical protein
MILKGDTVDCNVGFLLAQANGQFTLWVKAFCALPLSAILISDALVAQLDRASAFEAEGREFESLRARHLLRVVPRQRLYYDSALSRVDSAWAGTEYRNDRCNRRHSASRTRF